MPFPAQVRQIDVSKQEAVRAKHRNLDALSAVAAPRATAGRRGKRDFRRSESPTARVSHAAISSRATHTCGSRLSGLGRVCDPVAPMRTLTRFSLALVVFALMANSAAWAEAKRVLIVHSFGRATPPFATQSTAFQTTLTKEFGESVDMDEVSLDMASYGQPDLEGPFIEFMLARLSKWQPDLVIPVGAPAGQFVVKYRDRLFPQASIIYTAMDRRTLPADALQNNAAFVGNSFELSGLFDDILQLAPDTNHIAVVIGASPLERFWTKALRDAVEPFTKRVRVTWFNDLSFDETLRQVATLPPHSFILFGLLLLDAARRTPLRRARTLGNAV